MQPTKHPITRVVAALVLASAVSLPAQAQDLVINFDNLSAAGKKGFEDAVAAFREANPDMDVEVNITDREAYKTAIRNFLTADPPDVVAWYPGNRMTPFVQAGLFEDISDLWESEGWKETFASSLQTVTQDDKQWSLPYTYYQWGIYYRTDILEEQGIEPPQDWEELLAACATLKEADITCFSIGTKALWPAAGVFDHLDLRVNGYEFHNALTAGEIPYTDDRVRDVFAHWRELVDNGYFIENHAAMEWEDALPGFVNGDTAMYLIGNFMVEPARAAGLSDDQFDYMPFPTIDPDIDRAEDAPTDAFMIASGAKNKENAREFLKFIAQPEILAQWNETLNQLPPNSESAVRDDKFLDAGAKALAGAAGLAQFYDRDAAAEMAQAGMQGFQEFMVKPDRLDDILERLEKVRQRSIK